MPVNTHLRVVEITDFSPGLWENAAWLMPANAWQEMTDCYPQPGGGLRAFFKGTDLSVSGIANISKERVIGLHARGGVPLRSGAAGDGVDRYLATYLFDSAAASGSRARPRLYRMDGSNGETTWTQIYDTSGTTEFAFAANDNNAPQKASFRFFRLNSGSPNDKYVLMVLRYVGSDSGLWRLNYNDLSSAQKAIKLTTTTAGSVDGAGAIATAQARVLVAASNSERIAWSNPGTVTFSAANYLDIEPNQDLPVILALHPQAPSDLIVMKEGAPWIVVQGDITDPTVVQMGEGVHPGGSGIQDFGRTPEGITFIATDGYIYLTDGHTFRNISQQLAGFNQSGQVVSPGDTNFINEFLFVPGGYVYHLPTQSWFKQTQLTGLFHNVERYTRTIWGPIGSGPGFTLKTLSPWPDTARLSTWSAKTAPLRSEDGRQLEIREVELVVESYDSNAQISVTVGGTTVTKTLASAGRQDVSFLFKARGEVLDIRIVSTAGSSSNEAPSLEALRFYSRSGHQTY